MKQACTAFFNATFLLVSALNSQNFYREENVDREKLTNYLSSVLCSIDLKSAHIYFELETAGTFVDGIIAESSRCSPPTLTIITYEKDGKNIVTNTTAGARLVILIAKELDFDSSMFSKVIRIRKKFNFELFYMIVSEVKMFAGQETLLKTIYEHFNLLNVVVVAMENDSSAVITYNPFNNTIVRISNNTYGTKQLFFNKVSNIFGSPIHIVMYKDLVTSLTSLHGSKTTNFNYDTFLPELISSATNATLVLGDPSTDEFNIEDFGTVDLTMNGRSYETKAIMGSGVEETNVVRRNDICILLPYKRIRNTFEIIYRTVDPLVWSLMIVVMLLAWISLRVIRWAQHRCKKWRHVFIFDLFGLHVNQSLPHMPKKLPPRLIIASCLIYCLVIKSIFEGLLYTNMAKTRDTRLSTVAELLDSKEYEILISDTFYNTSEHFINTSPIENHFRVVESSQYINRYIKRAQSNGNYAFVFRKRVAEYLENTQMVNGAPIFYTMDECIVPFAICYFGRQGSPFRDQINKVMRIADESGIHNYWEKQVTNAYTKVKQSQRLFVHRSAINFQQLVFVFQALSYGLAIATGVFIIEWLYASRLEMNAEHWSVVKWCRVRRIEVE